ncbi:MAG: hypothetical protein K6D02_06670, partial [Lachnospiraceae bacterium]|nr:hypothetical protein [Lachnospiraceae bacterium]
MKDSDSTNKYRVLSHFARRLFTLFLALSLVLSSICGYFALPVNIGFADKTAKTAEAAAKVRLSKKKVTLKFNRYIYLKVKGKYKK